jgi:PAS domain S-box-containing protein
MQIQLSLQEICNFFMRHSDIVYTVSEDGAVTYVNENSASRLGLIPDEIIGRHFGDFMHPDDVQTVTDAYERAVLLSSPEPFYFDIRLRHKDGRFLNFEFISHPVIKDGLYRGAIGAGRDVTVEKITEEALGLSEERYRVLVESATDIIYTISPDGVITSINPFVKNATGWEVDEMIGRHFMFFMHPEEHQYAMQLHQIISAGQKPPIFELRFLKKSGEYLNAEFSITPLFIKGRFLGTLGIGRDVTERKTAEENLKTALAKERQLNELKQQFISMVSHEFRNPLTLIAGTAELLTVTPEARSSGQIIKGLVKIRDNVKRMAAMLDNIILITADEKKGKAPAAENVGIVGFCSGVVEDVLQITENRNRINLTYHESITKNSTLKLHREYMRHILVNLLTNAVKYSPEGEDVEFHLSGNEKEFLFAITDKGIGIPEEDIKNLFQHFSRASNVGKIKGMGMGLSIVKKCVDMHNGDITLESMLNKGTRVTVRIPVS